MLGAASRDSDQGEHAIQMAGQCPPPPGLLSARDLDTIDLLFLFYLINILSYRDDLLSYKPITSSLAHLPG